MTSDTKIRVMIVDDSAIVRGLLSRGLEEAKDIEVIGSVFNGTAAIHQLSHIKPDIILLDVEMPGMDGITALPQLIRLSPKSRIIMVSMLTVRNAEVTLRALELGASDYVTKPSSRNDGEEVRQFYSELISKIRMLGARNFRPHEAFTGNSSTAAVQKPAIGTTYPSSPVKAIAVGCSTGGPGALRTLFQGLSTNFPHVPLFVAQHMPPAFTTVLAQHIGQYSSHPCLEGRDGDTVRPGAVYLAPGNYHMVPEKNADRVVIRLNQEAPVNFCRPSIDTMLEALADIYGRHLLAAILTGMGSDGVAGARAVVKAGGTVIVQDAQTSVVWGMPQAVVDNKLCSAVLPIEEIASYMIRSSDEKR